MFRNLTFNSIIWMVLGFGCFVAGVYYGWEFRRAITRMFPLPFGLSSVGLAMILCGLTNGFTDQSPLGRNARKLGILFFLVGLPLLLYGVWIYI